MSNLPYYKTLTTTNHKDAPLSTGVYVRIENNTFIEGGVKMKFVP